MGVVIEMLFKREIKKKSFCGKQARNRTEHLGVSSTITRGTVEDRNNQMMHRPLLSHRITHHIAFEQKIKKRFLDFTVRSPDNHRHL